MFPSGFNTNHCDRNESSALSALDMPVPELFSAVFDSEPLSLSEYLVIELLSYVLKFSAKGCALTFTENDFVHPNGALLTSISSFMVSSFIMFTIAKACCGDARFELKC